ncbi:MAG: murein hydrolase activator EnvC family protein [Sandaracinaceae bacterium]
MGTRWGWTVALAFALVPYAAAGQGLDAEAEARRARLGLGSTSAAVRLLWEGAPVGWAREAGDPAALDGTLRLPVAGGRFLRGWGSGAGAYHLAVDIGARPGTPVHAAAPGLVAYAGRGLRGYGNLVVLVHANGWVTAYAHHRRNRVRPGHVIAAGAVVGEVGATGLARGPHLHFILAVDGQHCDPMPLLRPRPLGADGRPTPGMSLVWDSAHRPSGIRCLRRDQAPHPTRRWLRTPR